MTVKVLDVSHHKGEIDWQRVKEDGVEGVIIKATDGYFMPPNWNWHKDYRFDYNWLGTKSFNWRGAYHFLRVDDENARRYGRPTSQEQIHYFYDVVTKEGLEWNDYVCLDIEQPFNQTNYLSKRILVERIVNAIKLTESLFKRKPIIYTGAWWWENYDSQFSNHLNYLDTLKYWMSHYWTVNNNNEIISTTVFADQVSRVLAPNNKSYCRLPNTIKKENVILWQYSDRGKIPGVNKNVDINMIIIPEAQWKNERSTPATDDTKTQVEKELAVIEASTRRIRDLINV